MAEGVLLIGPSGSGKSASTRNCSPEDSFYINVIGKRVPYKSNWKSQVIDPLPPPNLSPEQVAIGLGEKLEKDTTMLKTDNGKLLEAAILYIDEHRPEIKKIFVDDWQYVPANQFMRRASEKGYEKFTQIGREIWSMANVVSRLKRDDLIVYFLTHDEEMRDAEGNKTMKAKTIGKLVDDKITLEGMFTEGAFCVAVLFSFKLV